MDAKEKGFRVGLVLIWFWWGCLLVAPATAQPFTEMAASLGMAAPGPGAAWGDYDNDGDLDLYVASLGTPNLLYRHNADGAFTEVAASAGVDDPGAGIAAVWGDYDNDGDLDLYLNNRDSTNKQAVNRLYRNNGDGRFTEVWAEVGVSEQSDWGASAWGDYDNDGDLDLYATQNAGAGRLYRNNGDGQFSEVASKVGVDSFPGPVSIWGDYDNDGDLDLFVASSLPGNQLFQNKGDGTFAELVAGIGIEGEGLGATWGDYDQDGNLDLYETNSGGSNLLYRNKGDGTFIEVGASAGVDNPEGGGHGTAWGDYDNDGDLDLHVVSHNSKNRLYRNNGDGTFTDVAISLGMDFGTNKGSAEAWGDYDDDGDLDLYIANINPVQNLFYRNEGTSNRWLHVKLTGTQSNRSAIGTRVIAVAGTKRQIWEVDGGSGFCGQPSLTVEFGFGQTTMVDSLIIRWPSGVMQTFTHLETNQRLAITEDNPLITAVEEEGATRPSTFSLSQNFPNPFNPRTTIHYEVPEESEIRLTILDLAGQQVRLLAEGFHQPGQYSAVWDGKDASGRAVASGVYVYRLEVKGRGVVETRRMALVR